MLTMLKVSRDLLPGVSRDGAHNSVDFTCAYESNEYERLEHCR